jgi:hypothetical protein
MLNIRWLIIRADGSARVVNRSPYNLRADEVAYRLRLTVPASWGRIVGDIDITLPEAPEVRVDEPVVDAAS